MKFNIAWIPLLIIFSSLICIYSCTTIAPSNTDAPNSTQTLTHETTMKLPKPKLESTISLEEALNMRRSVREYTDSPLTLEEVSQLLWAAQGITSSWGGRTAPSAGALYPLNIYIAVGNVENLASGIYKYLPKTHELLQIKDEDVRTKLKNAALGQDWIKQGAIDIIITAIYSRTTAKYGDRGVRYVHMEAGHAAQNICLQAATLNLGMVTVGAFHDENVKDIIGLTASEDPLYIIPIGKQF